MKTPDQLKKAYHLHMTILYMTMSLPFTIYRRQSTYEKLIEPLQSTVSVLTCSVRYNWFMKIKSNHITEDSGLNARISKKKQTLLMVHMVQKCSKIALTMSSPIFTTSKIIFSRNVLQYSINRFFFFHIFTSKASVEYFKGPLFLRLFCHFPIACFMTFLCSFHVCGNMWFFNNKVHIISVVVNKNFHSFHQ